MGQLRPVHIARHIHARLMTAVSNHAAETCSHASAHYHPLIFETHIFASERSGGSGPTPTTSSRPWQRLAQSHAPYPTCWASAMLKSDALTYCRHAAATLHSRSCGCALPSAADPRICHHREYKSMSSRLQSSPPCRCNASSATLLSATSAASTPTSASRVRVSAFTDARARFTDVKQLKNKHGWQK